MSIKIRFTSEGYLSGIEIDAATGTEASSLLAYMTDGGVFAEIEAASAVARQAIKDTGVAAPKARQNSGSSVVSSGRSGGKSQPDGDVPECGHGPARWISGSKNGRDYAFYACSNPNWKDEGDDGKCRFERDGALVKAPNLMGQGETFSRESSGGNDIWASEGSGFGGKPPF